MKSLLLFLNLLLLAIFHCKSQDTFSIVALDSTTRQVGSAGASCLDLDFAGIANPAFLTDLLPDTGVINTQSYFIQANQDNARTRMRAGDSPAQIITWLVNNDAVNNPEFKQYGIVRFNGNIPGAAAHTGSACVNYKNHVTGSINGFYYAIQGNILKGQQILDSMEAGFRNTNGTLACRLMAAMQGAKVMGADTRCQNDSVSSLFAFLQVALPADTYGNPALKISLKTNEGDGIEPIDSLQNLFNSKHACDPLNTVYFQPQSEFDVFPNPATHFLVVKQHSGSDTKKYLILQNLFGVQSRRYDWTNKTQEMNLDGLSPGIYIYQLVSEGRIIGRGKIIIY